MAKIKKAPRAGFEFSDEEVEKLNEKYGVNTMVRMSDILESGFRNSYIPTGSHALDICLGGGVVKNRITEIRGTFSTFKSTLSLLIIANFHKQHEEGEAFYVDMERTFDAAYALRLGVDPDRLWIINPDCGEQASDAIIDLLNTGKDVLGIVDSLANLVPAAEIEASLTESQMGLMARLVNRLLRISSAMMKRSMYDMDAPTVTLVCLNQISHKIGGYGNPEVTPGGVRKDHYFSAMFQMRASPSSAIVESTKSNGVTRNVKYGQQVSFKISKNKAGGSQAEEGEFTFYEKDYKGHEPLSIDNAEALFSYGAFYDLIKFVKDSYRYEYLDKAKTVQVIEGSEKQLVKAIRASPFLANRLYRHLLYKVNPSHQLKPPLPHGKTEQTASDE